MRVPQTLTRPAMAAGMVAFKFSRRMRANPHRWMRIAQRVDPVHHSAAGVWIVTSHSAVTAALRHPGIGRLAEPEQVVMKSAVLRRIFKQTSQAAKKESPLYKAFSSPGIFTDPVLQPRLSAFLGRTFTPRRMAQFRPPIEEFVEPKLEEAAERGRIELIGDLAVHLPGRALNLLLGIPRTDEDTLREIAVDIGRGFEPSPMRRADEFERANRAASALYEYFSTLVAERRKSPGDDDLVSALVGIGEEESAKIGDELVSALIAVWFAGQMSSSALIGNGSLALLRHPQELARWHRDPSIESTAVEELLRYDSWTMVIRDAMDDVELEGRRIRRGSLIAILPGVANHDPKVFDDPFRLDLTRNPNPHLAFGGGPHYCLGAPLGRLQASVFFSSFARRFPKARIAPGGIVRNDGLLIRALSKLEVLTR